MRHLLRFAVILVRGVLPEVNHCTIYAHALPVIPAIELSLLSGILLALAVMVLFRFGSARAKKGSLKHNLNLAVLGLEFVTLCLLIVLAVVHIDKQPLWLVITGLGVEATILMSTGWLAKIIRQVDENWQHD